MSVAQLPEEISNLHQQLLQGYFPDVSEVYPVLFDYQARYNPLYRLYLKNLGFSRRYPDLGEIPFMPISFFKHHHVTTGEWTAEAAFKSSSTTGKGRSVHHIRDMHLYDAVSSALFQSRFGSPGDKVIMALLPGYMERDDSSLIHMVGYFMSLTQNKKKAFYLDQYDVLAEEISATGGREIILFGVPYAFLRCLEAIGRQSWRHVTIIETGGMKGKAKEMTRKELHAFLHDAFRPLAIHSEYGMTELLSQAYTGDDGYFAQPASMAVVVRELNDPFSVQKQGKPGVLNIFDMANIHTCSFIETEDMAVDQGNGRFEVIGRVDNREIRGCNLLAV